MLILVMAGLDPAIPLRDATRCHPKRGHRDKPGDDKSKTQPFFDALLSTCSYTVFVTASRRSRSAGPLTT